MRALGWLRDSRAEGIVYKKRELSGQNSLLWNKTRIPYKWIPVPKYKPDSAVAYYNKGVSKFGKGDFTGAIADYTQAITLAPESAKIISIAFKILRN